MPIYIFHNKNGGYPINCIDDDEAINFKDSRKHLLDYYKIEFAPTGKIIWEREAPIQPQYGNQQYAIEDFVASWNLVADCVHQTAVDKGWWSGERNNGEIIALIHSELSEALEALRHGNPPDDKIPEFSGAAAELADVVIRILDFDKARNFGVAEALAAKIAFNKTREFMHGNKKF